MEKRSPWAWIPSLYFAEGLPYVVVMTLSVIMYKRFGRLEYGYRLCLPVGFIFLG